MIDDELQEECASCGIFVDNELGCADSRKACGHHCNHSWTHDECCWCDMKW
jgi:hypothetical protein